MRIYMIFITVFLAACLVSSSPIDSRQLQNRPHEDQLIRVTRADHYVKGRPGGTNTHVPTPFPNLRKGEYICGNKVCKLRPGEKPPCEFCQYPL